MNMPGGRKIRVLLTAVCLGWTFANALQAEPRLGQEPSPRGLMEAQGELEYMDLAGQTIRIDGRVYAMSPDTVWYGLPPEPDLETQLRRLSYKRIGFALHYQGDIPVVYAVSVLPEDDGAGGHTQ